MSTTNLAVVVTAGRMAGQHGVIWDDRQGAKTVTVVLTHSSKGETLATVRRSSLACEFCDWGCDDIADDPEWHADHCAA